MAIEVELSPVDGVQVYVFPAIGVIPIVAPLTLLTHVLEISIPAPTVGPWLFTVTKTWSDAVQPLELFVTVKE